MLCLQCTPTIGEEHVLHKGNFRRQTKILGLKFPGGTAEHAFRTNLVLERSPITTLTIRNEVCYPVDAISRKLSFDVLACKGEVGMDPMLSMRFSSCSRSHEPWQSLGARKRYY